MTIEVMIAVNNGYPFRFLGAERLPAKFDAVWKVQVFLKGDLFDGKPIEIQKTFEGTFSPEEAGEMVATDVRYFTGFMKEKASAAGEQ